MTQTTFPAFITLAEELVKARMANYDPSHDWPHVDRVRKMALKIAKTMDPVPDLEVVEAAALFHDLDDKKYTTPDSPTLASLLAPIFSSSPLTPEQIQLILDVVPNVSYTTETKLLASGSWTWQADCPALHAVQDADRLDAVGAVGVMRCAAYSSAVGRKLLADEGDRDESAEGHFPVKLLKVRDRMKTAYGKEEAERRHITMLEFLSALSREKEALA
ncbi:hypothetical protein IAT38_005620 [Cryptococcus sp. DSM 104549]